MNWSGCVDDDDDGDEDVSKLNSGDAYIVVEEETTQCSWLVGTQHTPSSRCIVVWAFF